MVVLKKSSNLTFLLLLAFAIFVSSCARTQKLVEQGRYDEAVELATRKLSGKKRKKVKHVKALEKAFEKATQQDMQRIAKLENRPGSEERIVDVYRHIRKRQETVSPLLPLLSKKGYQAEFQFVKVDELETAAMKKAAKALYETVQYQLVDAERGDKLAARDAFHNLDKIENYFRNYKDVNELKFKVRELGMTHVLFEMKNNAQVVLPQEFENEVLRMGVDELNSGWNQFHLSEPTNESIDLKVRMNITQIDVSPERIKEREYIDSKEIEDGYDYVLDGNGNVMKDTLGNDIKVPRKVLIRARVFEVFQSKAAIVSGHLEYFDAKNNDLIRSTPISVESVFENYASHFNGDRRALSSFSRGRCDTRPLPFPLDEELLLQAAEEMKPIVREEILYSGANLAVLR
ncbi:MAG: hypothetical protein AB8F94_20405 [Saprospiraceae bacterium]